MQYVVTLASTRSRKVEALVKSAPTLLVWRGQMRREAMEEARVSEAEILTACRNAGKHGLDEVEALVLESAGEFSVLSRRDDASKGPSSTLRLVDGVPDT